MPRTKIKFQDVDRFARMKYPRIGQPMKVEGQSGVWRYTPHIVDSESSGKYLDFSLPTIEECLEVTRQKVNELREILGNLTNF
jgi:hypothetical protein